MAVLRAALKAAARHRYEFGGFFDRPPAEPPDGEADADDVWIVDPQMLRAALQGGSPGFDHIHRSGCLLVATRTSDLPRLQDHAERIAGIVLVDRLEEDLNDAVLLARSKHMMLPVPILNCRQCVPERRPPKLPPEQQQLLRHLACGMTNKQIAAAMELPSEAVKALIRRLLGQLGFRNRTEAAVLAVRSGLSRAAK